jgi:hypothetical protein
LSSRATEGKGSELIICTLALHQRLDLSRC